MKMNTRELFSSGQHKNHATDRRCFMEIVEINPTDKAEEIKTLLMGLNSEVKTSTDEGYTWLQDHSICVIAHNPTQCSK